MRRAIAGIVLAALAAAPRANAQRVRGVLTDSTTREPVPRAVVVLYDSAGRGLARSIADANGNYSVFRSASTRKLRVMRIGFRPRELTLGAADSIVDVRLQPVPSLIGAVRAVDDAVCAGSGGSAALELWEQARAGLLAAVVSREASPPRIRLRTYRRTLDPVLRRPIADTAEYNDVVDGRSFVAARPAWVFADYGYMRDFGGVREFYAPDDVVLLDPTFAETHCLRIIEGEGARAGQIGMAFDPISTPERDTLVDVTGALWLDHATFQPRTIEFHYTNLENQARGSGGEINFTLMPNGIAMIDRWEIRSAVLSAEVPLALSTLARRPLLRRDRKDVRVLAYRQIGGQIASALWADGKRWVSDLPRIQGTVIDVAGAPVANAVVWIMHSRDSVLTDSVGHFRFPPIGPGLYHIAASDSALAVAGVARTVPKRAVVLTNANADLELRFYSRSDIFPTVCPAKSYRLGTGVLFAKVVDSLGNAVPNARVQIETRARGDTSAADVSVRVGVTGDDGRFVVCGAELDRRLIVRAFKGADGAGIAIDRWGDEVLSLSLTLRPMPLGRTSPF